MKKLLSLLTVILLAIFVFNCSDDDNSNPVNSNNPSLAGNWTGTGAMLVIEMNLTQNGTSVSGSGTMQGILACSVSGSNNYPDVSLTFLVTGAQPTTFTGAFSHQDTVSGKLNGSGFTNYDMLFVRQ